MKKTVKPEIMRTVTFEGQTAHPLEPLFEKDDGREIISIGMVRLPDSKYFSFYKIWSKGGQITKVELEEPNTRQVVEETAKISFVREFMDHDR